MGVSWPGFDFNSFKTVPQLLLERLKTLAGTHEIVREAQTQHTNAISHAFLDFAKVFLIKMNSFFPSR
jgi:hypothetical protein